MEFFDDSIYCEELVWPANQIMNFKTLISRASKDGIFVVGQKRFEPNYFITIDDKEEFRKTIVEKLLKRIIK